MLDHQNIPSSKQKKKKERNSQNNILLQSLHVSSTLNPTGTLYTLTLDHRGSVQAMPAKTTDSAQNSTEDKTSLPGGLWTVFIYVITVDRAYRHRYLCRHNATTGLHHTAPSFLVCEVDLWVGTLRPIHGPTRDGWGPTPSVKLGGICMVLMLFEIVPLQLFPISSDCRTCIAGNLALFLL